MPDANGQPQQPPNGIQMPPELVVNVGELGDKVVLQIVMTKVVEPEFARQLSKNLADAADNVERVILVPKKPPLVIH